MVRPEDTISISACLPVSMRCGLDEASKRTNFSKADIIRSVLYGYLVDGGFMSPIAGIDDDLGVIEQVA